MSKLTDNYYGIGKLNNKIAIFKLSIFADDFINESEAEHFLQEDNNIIILKSYNEANISKIMKVIEREE